jgi:hypothetical protein
MRPMLQRFVPLILAGVGLCLASCSNRYVAYVQHPESGATLEGSVTYGGQKVLVALVIAQGPNGSANAFIDDDGKYHIANAPLGEINIAVNTDAGKGQMISKAMSQSRGKGGRMPSVVEVPGKFGNPATSGIKTTINKGANTFDIVLDK